MIVRSIFLNTVTFVINDGIVCLLALMVPTSIDCNLSLRYSLKYSISLFKLGTRVAGHFYSAQVCVCVCVCVCVYAPEAINN